MRRCGKRNFTARVSRAGGRRCGRRRRSRRRSGRIHAERRGGDGQAGLHGRPFCARARRRQLRQVRRPGRRTARVAVAVDRLARTTTQRKHVGSIKYEDFTLQIGGGDGQGVVRLDEGLVRQGRHRQERLDHRRRLQLQGEEQAAASAHAFITEVTIPALDAAAKDPGYLAVSVSAATVTPARRPPGRPCWAESRRPGCPRTSCSRSAAWTRAGSRASTRSRGSARSPPTDRRCST